MRMAAAVATEEGGEAENRCAICGNSYNQTTVANDVSCPESEGATVQCVFMMPRW